MFCGEVAVCVGKHDSDKERPTICAVCGEPLGASGYYSFCLRIPGGGFKDMMIGTGCIRDRIAEEELDIETGYSPKETLDLAMAEFPQSGRWYGTFLHHCIAKPYVRNKDNAERWDESILELPSVRYIMDTIDELRDKGWNLDAEKVLDCGSIDLLATHPEMGTLVFDWKSDLAFDNHAAYLQQVNRYMAELHAAGMRKISGYIIWIRDRRREYVPFEGAPDVEAVEPRSYVPSQRIKCTLTIEMNGGSGIRRKTMTEYSHHRTSGDAVFFYIPPCDPYRYGYEFDSFEASPCREGEHPQWFNGDDAREGLRLSFACSKKRHRFTLTAEWKEMQIQDYIMVPHSPKYNGAMARAAQNKGSVQGTAGDRDASSLPSIPNPWEAVGAGDLNGMANTYDPAERSFTPGRIYASGGRYHGIYKRTESSRSNARGMVLVAEVDCSGKKISGLEWRHVYTTRGGKEFIYGLTNHEWKVYTSKVFADLSPEGMEIYGRWPTLNDPGPLSVASDNTHHRGSGRIEAGTWMPTPSRGACWRGSSPPRTPSCPSTTALRA